jgi:CBS domain containing-hemolysin-like protein
VSGLVSNGLMILFALVLVALNGLFVAAEFAFVKIRATQVDRLVRQVISIVPLVVVWVWMRAVVGLYPGYSLGNKVEELRRQTVALFATVTIIAVFAFASQLGGSLFSRPVLVWWALALLVVAPVVRHYVKASLLRDRRL